MPKEVDVSIDNFFESDPKEATEVIEQLDKEVKEQKDKDEFIQEE